MFQNTQNGPGKMIPMTQSGNQNLKQISHRKPTQIITNFYILVNCFVKIVFLTHTLTKWIPRKIMKSVIQIIQQNLLHNLKFRIPTARELNKNICADLLVRPSENVQSYPKTKSMVMTIKNKQCSGKAQWTIFYIFNKKYILY